MVMILSPFPKLRFCDNNGDALTGGKLFTYIAGTTTKTPTYTDSGGGTPNTNPIILDTRGECNCWLNPAINYKFVLSPSTDTDPPTNAIWTIDNIVPPNSATVTLGSIADSLAGTSTTVAATPAGTAKAIQQGFTYGVATGTANAVSVSPTITPQALANGMRAQWIVGAGLTNTGAATLNYGGLGTVDLKKWSLAGPVALGGGELVAGNLIGATYLSSVAAWVIDSPNGASVWSAGTIFGLTLSRVGATTYGIAVGNATSEQAGTQQDMTLASAFTKTLSAFAAGTGNGSLATGSINASTWYHVHMIRKDSDGSIDFLLSGSATAPTMPGGYTARRRIGSILTNGASQIVAFSQVGDEFLWDAAVVDADIQNPGTAAVSRTVSTPLNVKTIALMTIGVYGASNTMTGLVSSLDVSDQALQTPITAALTGFSNNGGALGGGGVVWGFSNAEIRTNTSSQVRTRVSVSGANDRIGIITRGWLDSRGR